MTEGLLGAKGIELYTLDSSFIIAQPTSVPSPETGSAKRSRSGRAGI